MSSSPADPPVDIEQLVDAHHRLVFGYCYRLVGNRADAEDLSQQTFLSAHQKLHQLRDPAAASGWLCQIAFHAFLKLKRSRRTRRAAPLDAAPEPPEDGADRQIEQGLLSEELQAAVLELPPEFRGPVLLFYFEDFSYKQIAQQLDIPLGTVMSRLSRGRKQLRDRLEGETNPAPADLPPSPVNAAQPSP